MFPQTWTMLDNRLTRYLAINVCTLGRALLGDVNEHEAGEAPRPLPGLHVLGQLGHSIYGISNYPDLSVL